MRFLKAAREDEYSMQLISLIDILMVLLIFFMASTTFVGFSRQIDIELPESKAGNSPKKTRTLTIEINREGLIFVNGEKTDVSALAVRAAAGPNEEIVSAVIRADKGLNYGTAVEVMGICRQAGIKDIGLAVL